MEKLIFTSAALLEILLSIKELDGYGISIVDRGDAFELHVGDSVYELNAEHAEVVPTDAETVETLDDIEESAYDELSVSEGMYVENGNEIIEGGPIKELFKTLFIGGVARLAAKTLKD